MYENWETGHLSLRDCVKEVWQRIILKKKSRRSKR